MNKATILLLVCLLATCSKSPTGSNSLSNPIPGAFALTEMSGLSKLAALSAVTDGNNVSINLGQINASKNFYFALRNVGDFDIDSIVLSISGTGYSISPTSITSLPSETVRNREVGLMPIIQVSVTHGYSLNGIGWVGVLPKGDNTGLLTIAGKTQNAQGRDTTTTLTANLDVFANLMDLKVYADTAEMNLDWAHSCGNIGDMENGFWISCMKCSVLHFVNTGNVPIEFTMVETNCGNIAIQDTLFSDSTLKPLDTMSITIRDSLDQLFMYGSSANVISNIEYLPLSTLGIARKVFTNLNQVCGN